MSLIGIVKDVKCKAMGNSVEEWCLDRYALQIMCSSGSRLRGHSSTRLLHLVDEVSVQESAP